MATGGIAYDALRVTDPSAITTIGAIMRSHPDWSAFQSKLAGLDGTAHDRRLFELMARWPDDMRETPQDRPEWHYALTVVSGWRAIMPFAFGNAVSAYDANLALLRNPSTAAAERAVALCWIMHIVGDLHQPLHTGHAMSGRFPLTDRGGTKAWVKTALDATPMTLHDFWDRAADRPGEDAEGAAAIAQSGAQSPPVDTGKELRRWMKESRVVARDRVYNGATFTSTGEDAPIVDGAYIAAARTLAEARIANAGHRIASTLQDIL